MGILGMHDTEDIFEAFEGFEDVGVTRVLVTLKLGDQSRAIQAFGDSVILEL
jgi:hypothetical protein